MIKVSVITPASRPGYIDTLTQALCAQTLPASEFEWILVDDLWERRKAAVKSYVAGRLDLIHCPPPTVRPTYAAAEAMNLGIRLARGELLYFCGDYMYPFPGCLERHWQIYVKYGPKCFISGRIIDGLTAQGVSIYQFQRPLGFFSTLLEGDRLLSFVDYMPPLPLLLAADFNISRPDNHISILEDPFSLKDWPDLWHVDWRFQSLMDVSIEHNLWRYTKGKALWWALKNDSAPTHLVRECGGMSEIGMEYRLSADRLLMDRFLKAGAIYLADALAPAYLLPHPFRKSGARSTD